MEGPEIVAHTLSRPGRPDRYGNAWQYHSRSDRHSKVACWAVLFEMLERSPTLRRHVEAGKVVLGVNKELRDFESNRSKNLDLVIATPAGGVTSPGSVSLGDLALRWGVRLSPDQRRRLEELPPLVEGPTGMVLVALEAKACMTAHIKARPRLFDELNSSHQTVHAHSSRTLAAGFVMINNSDTFISPDLNKFDLSEYPAVMSKHQQPRWTEQVLSKMKEIKRRPDMSDKGFDALGLVVVDMKNDGSPVTVVEGPPALPADSQLSYDGMLTRLIQLYGAYFHEL